MAIVDVDRGTLANGEAPANSGRLVAGAVLAFIGATSGMVGSFFRELAVLLVIFVPLELWKPQLGGEFTSIMWHVGEGTVLFLGLGMFCEYVAIAALRIKRDLEG